MRSSYYVACSVNGERSQLAIKLLQAVVLKALKAGNVQHSQKDLVFYAHPKSQNHPNRTGAQPATKSWPLGCSLPLSAMSRSQQLIWPTGVYPMAGASAWANPQNINHVACRISTISRPWKLWCLWMLCKQGCDSLNIFFIHNLMTCMCITILE